MHLLFRIIIQIMLVSLYNYANPVQLTPKFHLKIQAMATKGLSNLFDLINHQCNAIVLKDKLRYAIIHVQKPNL